MVQITAPVVASCRAKYKETSWTHAMWKFLSRLSLLCPVMVGTRVSGILEDLSLQLRALTKHELSGGEVCTFRDLDEMQPNRAILSLDVIVW